jgi:hypothetical protein
MDWVLRFLTVLGSAYSLMIWSFLIPQALEILGRCEAFEQAAKGELQSIDLRWCNTDHQ